MRIISFLGICGLSFSGIVNAGPITEDDLRKHIKILASDEFEGRKPGTEGENKSVNYIATQWVKAGLKPAASKNLWYQPVELIERYPIRSKVAFMTAKNNRQKNYIISGNESVLRGRAISQNITYVPVIFAGYANESPDRLRQLVSGKLALLPLRKPIGRDDLPDYNEREKRLVAAGAAAVIAIVDGESRWNRMERSFERSNTTLTGHQHHAAFEGIIKRSAVRKIFQKAGFAKHQLELWQDDPNFRATDLPITADLFAETEVRNYISHNVIGKIAGSNPESGAIVFLGHWDHFGVCRREDPVDPKKDRICNGAVDNASGIALLIETAKRLADSKFDRDIFFLATTAEEIGLLGAYAFIENPPIPLGIFVAAFNADTIALTEEAKKIAVVGLGKTSLDVDIEDVASLNDREIDRSGKTDAYLKRQDGYAFLENDIPAFMITSAFADEERLKAFISGPYHGVDDEYSDDLPLGGATADANFHVALGRYFGNIETYPQKASSE